MLSKEDWEKELTGAKAALEAHTKGKAIMEEMVEFFESKVASTEDKEPTKETK